MVQADKWYAHVASVGMQFSTKRSVKKAYNKMASLKHDHRKVAVDKMLIFLSHVTRVRL